VTPKGQGRDPKLFEAPCLRILDGTDTGRVCTLKTLAVNGTYRPADFGHILAKLSSTVAGCRRDGELQRNGR